MKHLFPLIALGLLTACETKTTTTQTTTMLPLFGDGYRADGDQCRRVGESAETVEYLDHTADLVACPEDWAEAGSNCLRPMTEITGVDKYQAKAYCQFLGFTLPSVNDNNDLNDFRAWL